MAKEREIPINTTVKVDAKEASDSIEKFGDKVEDLQRRSRGAAQDGTKAWGDFANLFSGLLPRNVQMLIRKFQSTQRQVGRLATSLKFLKGAFAGLGIGLLIIGLETLIERWDDISRLITGVTKQQERQNKVVQAGAKAIEDYNTRNAEYVRIVQDSTEASSLREQALNELATQIREIKDLDLNNAKDLERFNLAIERNIELVGVQTQQQELLNQINELRNEKDEVKIGLLDWLGNKQHRENVLAEKKATIDTQINGLIEQYTSLQVTRLDLESQTTEELARQAKQQEYLRWLEQSRLKYGRDWEFMMDELDAEEEERFEQSNLRLADELVNKLKSDREYREGLLENYREWAEEMDALEADNAAKKKYYEDQVLQLTLENLEKVAQARIAGFRAAENIASNLERLAQDGTNAQKAFAVTQVLLSQAQAVQAAITAALQTAAKLAAAGTPAPVVTPLLIAQMVGIALGSFAQVKSILQQAGASTGGAVQRGGGGRGVQTQALVPQGVGGKQQTLPQVNQAYVVQSQLQGQMWLQSGLEKRIRL